MADSSDNDDLPDLVESSDEDNQAEKKVKKTNVDLASSWLNKSSKFLEKQELWMRIFSLCPFLFGINNIVSAAWMKALFSAKLLLNEKRQYELTYLEWQEWECVDLIDHIIPIVHNKLRKKEVLFRCLDCVDILEGCKKGVIIDVDLAIQAAMKYDEVSEMWTTVLQDHVCKGKETAARFGVLYIIKLYHCHVISIEVNQKDFVEEKKKEYKNPNASKKAEEFKKKGNEFYSQHFYKESIDCYTDALKIDPFHHIYFGNRAQAYNKLREFKEALADGRRAVTIKPDFSKGHYRYGQAFYELGQLEAALRVNKKGLALCEKERSYNYMNVKDLEDQGDKFRLARLEGEQSNQILTPIPKELERRLESLSLLKGDFDLNKKFGVEEPPMLVSSTSGSESDSPLTPAEFRRKRKKSKSKARQEEKELSRSKDMSKNPASENSHPAPSVIVVNAAQHSDPFIIAEDLKTSKLKQDKTELRNLMAEGSEASLKNVNKTAVVCYKKALDITLHTTNLNDLGLDSGDILTLKYVFGMAAVSTGVHKNILEGMEKFNEILEVNVQYPMAYYGLGKAYLRMNRFMLALQKLQEGHRLVEKIGLNLNCEYWPGTRTVLEESDPKCLKQLLEESIQECHFHPPPDGVCRHHTDHSDPRTDIYKTDPDFKGLYQIFCEMDCVVSLHPHCWKDYKAEHNTTVDKDILDTACLTPDCSGLIIKLIIERDLTNTKELNSEKHGARLKQTKDKKPVVKMKSTSDFKMAKKKDKKDLRKQRRRERLEENGDLVEEFDKLPHQIPETLPPDYGDEVLDEEPLDMHPLPDVKEAILLKKNEINTTKVVAKQKKNKKKKSKQLLTLEVNFSDRKEDTLLGENSVLSDEEQKETAKSVPTKPVPMPIDNKKQVKSADKAKTTPVPNQSTVKVDDITQNLFSYFVDILKVNGPLAIDDTRIQQELEVFPLQAQDKIKNAGGLADFLKQSFKFAVIDDVISLMTDAVKARDIALFRREQRGKLPQTPPDAWKTVGKGNDVDSLKESVTNSSLSAGKTSYVSVASNAPNKSSFSSVAMTPLKGSSSSPLLQDTLGKNMPGLSASNSSVSSIDSAKGPIKVSDMSKHKQSDSNVWSSGDVSNKEKLGSSSIDTLDSIDDFPLPKSSSNHEVRSKFMDDLDDFDIYPDTKKPDADNDINLEEGKRQQEAVETIKSHVFISDSSSDISETSDISVETSKPPEMPKPLKPIGRFGKNLAAAVGVEYKTDTSLKNSVNGEDEIQKLADDFIKNTDAKFVSELAESVVDKLYSGKTVSDVERANTFKQVSDDIRKDFEKSANSGNLTSSGIWAHTPASADYSENMGKFANDFMKKHYQKENMVFSPTSDLATLFPPSPSPSNFGISDTSYKIHSPLMTSDLGNESRSSFSPSFISPSSSSNSIYTSGYNLFSGPSLGLDSLSAIKSPSPLYPPSSQQQFIRPPPSATSYYNSIPPPPIGSQPRPLTPLRMPSFHSVLKIDKETQVVGAVYCSVQTMTEPHQYLEWEVFLQLKADSQRLMRETTQYKEKADLNYKSLELKHKDQQSEYTALQKIYESEKKKWVKDKNSLQEEVKTLKDQLAQRKKTEAELKKKISAGEKQVNELTKKTNEQKEKNLLEIKKCMEETDKHKQTSEEQRERARNAEIEILKSKLNLATQRLKGSMKESAFHVQHLEGFVKKIEGESKPVPAPIKQSLDHWRSVAQFSEETLERVKTEYESQISEVSGGKLMSELSPILIPSPPQMPEALKSFTMRHQSNVLAKNMSGKMPLQMPSGMPHRQQPFGPMPTPPNNPGAVNGTRFPVPSQAPPEYNMTSAAASSASSSQSTGAIPPRPLQGAAGLVPPRPLSGARPPLATPNRPLLRPPVGVPQAGIQGAKTSFEKLILKLQIDFPNHNRADFNQFIQTLRQNKGGSLSGMSMQDIIIQVSELIKQKDRQSLAKTPDILEKPKVPPPGLSASWAFPVGGVNNNNSEMFQEDEDPCAICHEDLTIGSAITLECDHQFHDTCIRKWFKEQSTCPNCRVHSLLSDEFPSLG